MVILLSDFECEFFFLTGERGNISFDMRELIDSGFKFVNL